MPETGKDCPLRDHRDTGDGFMKYALPALMAATLLAGCDKKVDLKDASVSDVAKATKDANFITPGQWSNTTEIVSVDLSGMPEKDKQMGEAMTKAMVGRKQTVDTCVTEEQAKKPAAEMFAGKDNGDCKYDSFTMSGGKVDAVMTCTPKGQPGSMKMTMNGVYTDKGYNMDVSMAMTGGPGAMGSMAFKARNTGTRTGDCTAGKS